jgi:hypothetical protein
MMHARTKRRTLGLGAAACLGMVAAMALNACGGATGEESEDECVSNETFFKEQIWVKTLSQKCISCHTTEGAAKDSSFILRKSDWGPDYIEQNYNVFEQMAKLRYDGEPWILMKPTNRIEHGGLVQFEVDDETYKEFQEMIDRIADPVACDDEADPSEEFFAGVELLDEVQTLRKATLALVGRLPSAEEEQRVRDGGFEALDLVLDEMMTEDAFFERLTEIYNDKFLTDRYYPDTMAIDLLNQEAEEGPTYPGAYWFDSLPEDQIEAAAGFTNKAVARESLALINHVVRNDLPYSEILTADYTMVNPFSAKSLGVEANFETGAYDEFVPAQVPGVPHAGVLTNTIWMNRFPTTPTNRNRHRARMLYDIFLATDVLRLGERPLTSAGQAGIVNPTMNDQQCTLCHSVIDPMAGALQNWNEVGAYAPLDAGWYPDMRQPGFGDQVMPASEYLRSEQWLAQQLVADSRFALAPVHVLFKGLSGQDPMREPSDVNDEFYLQKIRAFDVQTKVFQEIADEFVADGYNLKSVVKEIVKTPYYRAVNASGLSPEREAELAEVGTGRLLTPEQLHRKIEAITGQPWRANESNLLLSQDEYLIFYGGINHDDVTTRIEEPNGIMANVATRMANEMACWTVAQDFSKDPTDRKMFPFVEIGFEPEDVNGFEVSGASSAIKANIQYLHQRLLGEFVDLDDPEILRSYDLYLEVWKDGRDKLALAPEMGGYSPGLPGQCQAVNDPWTGEPLAPERQIVNDDTYTVRAWMAVLSYMLADYRFLHE